MNRYLRNRSHTAAESVTLTVSDDSCLLLIRKKIVSEKKPGFAPMRRWWWRMRYAFVVRRNFTRSPSANCRN